MIGTARVGIVGASGYVGGELLRILSTHPQVTVAAATSRKYAGDYVHRVHPNLRGVLDLQFTDLPEAPLKECDLLFTALPHGAIAKQMQQFVATGISIIDLSADFRLKDPQAYVRWYGYEHPNPELLEKFVYGVPELHRTEIRQSKLVATPGCMAVTSILALAPLFKDGVVDTSHVVVDAKIGSSGGGARPSLGTHHAERYGVVRPYKPVGHRHTAEIEQELKLVGGRDVLVSMTPHAVNMVRGILCTCHVFATKELTPGDVWRVYRSFYQSEPFIRYVRDKKGLYRLPDPKVVIGSNFCDIGFEVDERAQRLVVLAATDNLVKGAAGTAVQCMNLMLGLDERLGLMSPALHPV